MGFFKTFTSRLCLFSLLFSTTLAAPVVDPSVVDIVKRDRGDSPAEAIDAYYDISLWPSIAEQDCYVALCLLGGKRIYQRGYTDQEANRHRTQSGASLRPFRDDQLAIRHTSQISHDTTSAEEFPWASIHDPDTIYVQPATLNEQDHQGATINGAYSHHGINHGKWFKIIFTIPAPNELGQYCTALQKNPPDFTLCGKRKKQTLFNQAGILLAGFVYEVAKNKRPFTFIPAKQGSVRKARSGDSEKQEISFREVGGEGWTGELGVSH